MTPVGTAAWGERERSVRPEILVGAQGK